MSSITGLISGGGGGGGETHIKTDPRQLTRSAASYFYIKQNQTNVVDSDSSTFWDRLGNITRTSISANTSSNTYVNLLNITNAPNGGYLNWIISPRAGTSNASTTIRITVDGGDPYEFTYVFQGIPHGFSRMFIGGGGYTGNTPVGNTYGGSADLFKSFYTVGFASSSDAQYDTVLGYDDNTNHVYGAGYYLMGVIADFHVLNSMPFEKLKFESSILIQVKQQVLHTTNYGNYSACFYTLH